MAVDLILCGRGIPCIYYGTEQGLHNDTNQGNDPYNRPMMDRWDEDTPLYRDIACLAQLRRQNLAVQKGSMLTRALSDDVYVFERVYMGHSCLVALNKGPQQRVPLAQLALPDGAYENAVGADAGGKEAPIPLQVRGGCAELHLPKDAVQIYHHTPAVPTARAIVTLQLNGYRAQPGEQVYVLGDCPELGSWDQDRARALEWINANTWSLDVAFDASAGQRVRYKYAIKNATGQLLRENTLGHHHTVPTEGRTSFRDHWQVSG
jgi:cyclomaltodextrin glucanotransferase